MKVKIEELTLEALDLAVGQSKRVHCPKCRATDECSLKLTRTESGISYVCFRGKCGFRGYTGQLPSGRKATKPKYPGLHFFEHPTRALSSSESNYLVKTYGLTLEEIVYNRIMRQEDDSRIVMPIFDAVGDIVGYVSKLVPKGIKGRKSMTYWHKERPSLHYPREAIVDGPVALVEDTLSAIRVARYSRCRALIGTFLSDLAIEQLANETDHLILALDNDMVGKMTEYSKKLRGLFKVDIIVWPDDPKDISDNDVKSILMEYL